MAGPSTYRRGRTRRRASLLTRFALLSGVLLIGLGLVLGFVLQRSVRERALSDAIRTAEVAANVGVLPRLDAADLERDFAPLPAVRVAALDRDLAQSLSENGIVRLKVWNRQHWLVYSDNPALRKRWFPGNDLLAASFAGGTVSEITDLTAPEEFEERDFGKLLAVYVPLRANAADQLDAKGTTVVGAFEVYLPYQPIATAISDDTRRLWITLGVGLGILYVSLYSLVATASRRLRRQAAENEHQALHDGLTDLPNRRSLHQRLESALTTDGQAGLGTAAVLLDLDRFKEINDALGHDSGDRLLQATAQRLVDRLEPDTFVARLGGDEFAVLFTGLPTGVSGLRLGRTVARALDGSVTVEGLQVEVHASIGVAMSPDDGDDAATLVRHADVAMYVAKRSRSGVEVYEPADDVFDAQRLELAAEVRRAIDNDELVVFYQPKIDIRSGQVVGAEALVRWQHPQRGLLGPGEFLGVVEATELIKPLTMQVLDRALAEQARLRDAGSDLVMSVNLSAHSLGDTELPSQVADALVRHGVSADRLELELTETSILGEPARIKRVLDTLSEARISLAVDDFGTGYASLAYLTGLPVDVVKIDQSFIRDLTNPDHLAVVRSMIELGRSLSLQTVAEGVEDALTLHMLHDMGCDIAQGFYFSRPVPAEEFERWVRDRRTVLADQPERVS